jgi:GxxExxY protein
LQLDVSREKLVEVIFEGVTVGHYRADLVVNNLVLIEIKSCRFLVESDERQLQNDLKATSIEVGLMLHFGPKPTHKRFIYTNDRK